MKRRIIIVGDDFINVHYLDHIQYLCFRRYDNTVKIGLLSDFYTYKFTTFDFELFVKSSGDNFKFKNKFYVNKEV